VFDKGLFLGDFTWLRKMDLNHRPSGYEFYYIKSLNNSENPLNRSLLGYSRFYIKSKVVEIPIFFRKFCHLDKILTKKNCTKNCTVAKLKRFIPLFKCTKLYIPTYIYKKYKNFILFYIFTTSQANSQLKSIRSLPNKALNLGLIKIYYRLHELFIYILIYKFFLFSILFFLLAIGILVVKSVKVY